MSSRPAREQQKVLLPPIARKRLSLLADDSDLEMSEVVETLVMDEGAPAVLKKAAS